MRSRRRDQIGRTRRATIRVPRNRPRYPAPEIGVSSYEITREPVECPFMRQLSQPDQDRINRLARRVIDGVGNNVEEAEQLCKEFPGVPLVFNLLGGAYEAQGATEKARELCHEIYRKFPRYLFAIVNYASFRIIEGHPEEVPTILNRKFALDHLFPTRKVFHITEFAAFSAMMVRYFCAIGEREAARRYFELLEKVAPDEGATRSIGPVFAASALAVRFRSLLSRFTRGWRK